MKKILIIGGTGTIGKEMLSRWADDHQLTVISKDSHRQAVLSAVYPQVEFILCDVTAVDQIPDVFEDKDVIIHAAAMKVVSIGQASVEELWRVNLDGTYEVAKCFEMWGGDAVGIFLSSDKAVAPINYYGTTKMMGEAVCRKAGMKVVRYGNVVGSQGSFIEKWQEKLRNNEPISARDATRFFLTPFQAGNLIVDVIEAPGELFIPRHLKGFSILELAHYVAFDKVIVEPLQPGEKQHEQLLTESEHIVNYVDNLSVVEWGRDEVIPFSNEVKQMEPEEVLAKIGWTL